MQLLVNYWFICGSVVKNLEIWKELKSLLFHPWEGLQASITPFQSQAGITRGQSQPWMKEEVCMTAGRTSGDNTKPSSDDGA